MPEVVRYEVEADLAIITIDRPDRMNSITRGVCDGLRESFHRFDGDDTLRVAVLTGAGDRAFCAGMDLHEMSDKGLGVLPRDYLPILGDSVKVSKPVIAAVNGVAYAGGWLFAQMCDLVVASESAKFAITEARVGRGMAWAPPLIHMIPQKVLLELLITGTPISARRAYEIGFVNQVVPDDAVLNKAKDLARTIANNAPLTVAAAREMVRMSTEMGASAALDVGYQLFEKVLASQDAQEGPAAFREKRKPRWTGR